MPSPTTSRRKNSKQTNEKSLNMTYTVSTTQNETKADTAIQAPVTVKANDYSIEDPTKQETNNHKKEIDKIGFVEASNKVEQVRAIN